jgi:hypothetical protein
MKGKARNVEAYLLPEACRILQQAGFEVAVVATGNPGPYRPRVLRQRQLSEELIELTQAPEFYRDPIDEKEVKNDGLQDH